MTNKPMLSVERNPLGLSAEAYNVMLGMVEHCLNIRACMGMDEGFKDFDTEEEHDFVKELRALLDKPDHPCPALLDGCDGSCAPAVQHQGEPVACMPVDRCYDVRAKMIIAFNEAKKAGGDLDDALDAAYKSALRYSPNPMTSERPAPVAVVMPERSNQDYAIEHAEYMAQSADGVLEKFQAYGLALLAVDEGGDDGKGELFEAIDTARGDLKESLVDLRSMVYEFRKRSNRCTSL